MLPDESLAIIQKIEEPLAQEKGIQLFIKREDLIHPEISGNKWRKLKYNLEEARSQGYFTLLTYGGVFSNHIAAVACAGQEFGFKTIGVIRGEESSKENPTLSRASEQGMTLHFVDRTSYREKNSPTFLAQLKQKFGDFYNIPEGGSNCLAIKGCREILPRSENYDYVCISVGTGGTIAGLITTKSLESKMLGFSSLKGDFLKGEVENLIRKCLLSEIQPWQVISDYHFGGYAKFDQNLISFINDFKKNHQIQLDPIYTGKLFYGVINLISKGFFTRGSKILVVHTGGLQGINGFIYRYGQLIEKPK